MILSNDGELLSNEGEEITKKWDKLEAKFQFDSTGKLKVRDDFRGVTIFKSRSKVDPNPRRCAFKDGAVTTYNLVEPVSVLWSSRRWEPDAQDFKKVPPAMNGYTGPFEFVITRGKKIAITGMKGGKRRVAWFENPDYEDWTGRFDDN